MSRRPLCTPACIIELFIVGLLACSTAPALGQGPATPVQRPPAPVRQNGPSQNQSQQPIPLPQLPRPAAQIGPQPAIIPVQMQAPLTQQPIQPQPSSQPGQGQPPVQPQPVGVPFVLTQGEQDEVDRVLALWEKESGKINHFENDFTRHEYDPVFAPNAPDSKSTQSLGKITYAKPDKGEFKIDEVRRYDDQKKEYVLQDKESHERWVTDGHSIYEFNYGKKQLIQRELPKELQGKAIADGPLPFLFGAEAAKLKQRYYIRITPQPDQKSTWLEAYPRFQQDAANFQRVELILDLAKFLPKGMRVHHPNGKSNTVYVFQVDEAKVNGIIQNVMAAFGGINTPLGWKKIVERVPEPTPAQAPSGQAPTAGRVLPSNIQQR